MNDRDFADAMVWIVNSPVLAIDTETTGLHVREWDYCLGIGVANRYKKIYFPLRHNGSENLTYEQAHHLIDALSMKRHRILFHNAIFDWAVLRNEGWKDPGGTWDTMVAAWLLDENEPKKLEEQIDIHFGLEGSRAAKLQKERQKRIKKIGWANTTYDDMQEYGAFDVRFTYDLYLMQHEKLAQDESLRAAFAREMKFIEVCDVMIENGVLVDVEQAEKKLHECDVQIAILQDEYPGLNFDSTPQIAKLIFSDDGWGLIPVKFTPKGQPRTDKDTLLEYIEWEPRILDIFNFRKLRKARSTYYAPLVERQGRDGRVHAWYRPHGTKTGRMSCSDPNLQTLPHEDTLPGIKDCFIPERGYSIMEYDLEQAELRVAAYYADDHVLSAHLAAGDVHAATARAMFGSDDPIHRSVAKNLNFGALYGIGPQKFVTTARRKGDMSTTEDIARQHLGMWRNMYAGVNRASDEAMAIAKKRGYVKLWPEGRYRRFDTYWGRFEHPKDAFNYIVQGGVGEYVKEIMLHLREPAHRAGVRMILNVHDSVVFEVPNGMEEQWTTFVRQTAAKLNPFSVEMPIGAKSWKRS